MRLQISLIFCNLVALTIIGTSTIEARTNQAEKISREVPPNSNILPQTDLYQEEPLCGEWLNTNAGSIYYKAFEPVGENERCIWILGVPGASAFTINVQYLGDPTNKPPGHQELIITGIKKGVDAVAPTLTFYKPTETGVVTVSNANLAIVSFHTGVLGATPGTGFVIQYEAVLGGTTSLLSTHHILTSPTFDFKYPPNRSSYDANELAALVYPPLSHQYECNNKIVRFKRIAFDSGANMNCMDAVYRYNYNVSSVEAMGHWQYSGVMCQTTESYVNTFDDVVLYLFQSNADRHYQGFYTDYIAC